MSRLLGQSAEDKAAAYLLSQGCNIIARNVCYPFGELDIVAKDQQILVFVEVKHRKNNFFGEPYESVTKAKQRKIIKAAQAFMSKNNYKNYFCRFDIISLMGELSDPIIDHIKDAFLLEDSLCRS